MGAVVADALAGSTSTSVEVEFAGIKSNTIIVPVVAVSPGIFTANASGGGPGEILNEAGSRNSASNPADRGSIIVLHATGGGLTDPPSLDGQLATEPYPKPRLPVSVSIGGVNAEIQYAGAPGLVAGALEVKARVPADRRSLGTQRVRNVSQVARHRPAAHTPPGPGH